MNEEILVDPECAIRYSSSRSDFGVRNRTAFVDEVFSNGDLIDESGRHQLTQDFELLEFDQRCPLREREHKLEFRSEVVISERIQRRFQDKSTERSC